jgi:hypothetical protein
MKQSKMLKSAKTISISALQLSPSLEIIQQCLRLLLSLLPASIPGHLLPHLVLLAADQLHPVQEEEEGVEDDQEDSHTTNYKQGPKERKNSDKNIQNIIFHTLKDVPSQ